MTTRMVGEVGHSHSRSIQNRDNFEHVGEEDFVEEVRVAFFEAIEVDVFLETGVLATKLSKTTLAMVSIQEIRRDTRCGYRHCVHGQNGRIELVERQGDSC